MLCFFSKRLHLSLHTKSISLLHSKTLVDVTQNLTLSPFTSLSTPLNPHNNEFELKDRSFIASYLENPTKFSPEIAKTVSKKLGVKTLENCSQLTKLLRNYGFSDTQITKLIIKQGFRICCADPNNILPKLEFLLSAGVERSKLPTLVCSHSMVLTRSLNNFLIPTLNMLKILFPCYGDVGRILICLSLKNNDGVLKYLPRNVGVLRSFGIPQSIIIFMTRATRVACLECDKFVKIVDRAIEMGFDTNKYSFVDAAVVIAGMDGKTWDRRMEVYKSWGLSEDEVLLGFKKYPRFLRCSEQKIMKIMDFLVRKMGCKPADIAKSPYLFDRSFEKTVVLRCSVLRVLLLKGLIEEDINLLSAIYVRETQFLKSFVARYQEQVPQLLSIAEGKMSISELGYRFKGGKESIGRKERKKERKNCEA